MLATVSTERCGALLTTAPRDARRRMRFAMLSLDGVARADCGSRSWHRALDAAPAERAFEVGEQRVQSPVDVEGRGHLEQPRDLLRRQVVGEAQLEQQRIARREIA